MSFRRNGRMFNDNRFKLGLFAMNCTAGLSLTKGPDVWEASWKNNLEAGQMADAGGFEFLLPLARWHGHGGPTHTDAGSLETLTWASGMLAATKEIGVFATVHTPLINPIVVAKQCVTADLIGEGRLGLNVVAGWNPAEFEMFGIPLREHDERYAYSEEWITIIKRIWSETEAFDFSGQYFNLHGAIGYPKPMENRPLIISAGSSSAGRKFAVRYADCLFMLIVELDALPSEIQTLRSESQSDWGGIFASGHVVCRKTQKEADEYYRYIVDEMVDVDSLQRHLKLRTGSQSIPADKLQRMKERLVSGTGTFPIVGDPDAVAGTFKRISDAGIDGMAIGLINFIDEIPLLRDEVLPRMARLGLRKPLH